MYRLEATEKEIACRLCHGEKIEEIGAAMRLHTNTINYHIREMKKRFNCKSLVQLCVCLALDGALA
jgi:DNA-binding NarL/FixJ family response regulator